MECPQCHKTELVTKQHKSDVSLAGILGAFLLVIGAVMALASPIVGLLVIIVGVLIAMSGRRTITTLVCPACRYSTRL